VFVHNWTKCEETTQKIAKKQEFVHLNIIEIDYDNCISISSSGRLRWKIEKQGFDQQKNHGYNIEHSIAGSHIPG